MFLPNESMNQALMHYVRYSTRDLYFWPQ